MSNTMSDELVSNLVDFCENRLRVYAMLSRCFEKELDAAFAEELATKVAFASDDAALAEGFSLLQSDLAKRDEPALEQLAVAFNRVFFGMGPRAAQKAFPYESVYTSERGLMMQEAYSQVLRIYRVSGFAKDPKFTEPATRNPPKPPCASSWHLRASTCSTGFPGSCGIWRRQPKRASTGTSPCSSGRSCVPTCVRWRRSWNSRLATAASDLDV